ncbi:MAG: hypothetical protein ACOCWZ_00710 [Spirochaetota bacterium]
MSSSLCQPEKNLGCCACCGIFNLRDISRENCDRFLQYFTGEYDHGRYPDSDERAAVSCFGKGSGVRDFTSHICPFQGYLSPGKPGCLAHPLVNHGDDGRHRSLFGSKICGEFLCPAHSILDTHMRQMLIDCAVDWYVYSVGIIDPLSFTWIIEEFRSIHGQVWDAKKNLVVGALEIHAAYLNSRGIPVFYYGLSEYTAAADDFSLVSSKKHMDEERMVIKSFISGK